VLLHACGVTFGTILSEIRQYTYCLKRTIYGVVMEQHKTFFGNIKLTKWDNNGIITCFQNVKNWHNNVRKMGHLTPFCRNIYVITGQCKMFFWKYKVD